MEQLTSTYPKLAATVALALLAVGSGCAIDARHDSDSVIRQNDTITKKGHNVIQSSKSPNLPKPIAAYFDTDKGDSETLSRCFTENAVVKDEGNTYKGRAAIRQWKSDGSKKYKYTSEPFLCEQKDGKTVVTSRLTGNFPGSPVDLRFFFELEGDRIASLEIIP